MNLPLSIRDMVSIGFPLGSKDGWLLMLHMYLDDAGTHGASLVVGVGGLIGTDVAWQEFDRNWRALLAEPIPGKPPIKKWSSGDCFRGDGEFANYNQADKDLVTRRFRNILVSSDIYAVANMIDKGAWDEIMVPRFGGSMPSAEATALFRAITRILPWVAGQADGPNIAVFYDQGRNVKESHVAKLAKILNDAADQIPQIASFGFLKVADATPLQGADMIATESYWHALSMLTHEGPDAPIRAHFRDYLERNFDKGNGETMDRARVQADADRRNPDGSLKDTRLLKIWGARPS